MCVSTDVKSIFVYKSEGHDQQVFEGALKADISFISYLKKALIVFQDRSSSLQVKLVILAVKG
jgi:hypothetical protein